MAPLRQAQPDLQFLSSTPLRGVKTRLGESNYLTGNPNSYQSQVHLTQLNFWKAFDSFWRILLVCEVLDLLVMLCMASLVGASLRQAQPDLQESGIVAHVMHGIVTTV